MGGGDRLMVEKIEGNGDGSNELLNDKIGGRRNGYSN